ncbi:Rgg/GadR/MutR family transcriptional activator [Enterococcus sp. PF1-24]|uniref:Rgg family transcriptional regulator n=1 Tax=unclassified Enterococcus TaxID=2608891 RepID=UPI0024758344|nr:MULTISPECIES: hypothetical protein [unclassified Enterococcus]MDH6363687.1 Rgg/GadR/MutR family transcriptional activator [Enterococcus sp. PFB1-1]MDH6400643.1 Rgg/GadR/MutR family transcriptional activator [Enterococcus sp. PF1-24]
MEYGETISKIQTEKNIPVKDLCHDFMSKSTYSRFVNGESDTTTTVFFHLLEQLHISSKEFFFIKNDYSLDNQESYLLEISSSSSNRDTSTLYRLKKECDLQSKRKNDTFHHLSAICFLHICRIKNKKYDVVCQNDIKNYLLGVASWSRYEIVLFNSVMFIFDLDFIEKILPRLLRNVSKYKKIIDFTSDNFGILLNIYTLYLMQKKLDKALYILKKIKSLDIPELFVRERLYLNFLKGINQLLLYEDSSGFIKITDTLNTCNFLNLTSQKSMLVSFYNTISTVYKLPNLNNAF